MVHKKQLKDNGVMFKVTAKTCKEWADLANASEYDELLTKIAETARSGKYSVHYDNLTPSMINKLTIDGFIVNKLLTFVTEVTNKYIILWE